MSLPVQPTYSTPFSGAHHPPIHQSSHPSAVCMLGCPRPPSVLVSVLNPGALWPIGLGPRCLPLSHRPVLALLHVPAQLLVLVLAHPRPCTRTGHVLCTRVLVHHTRYLPSSLLMPSACPTAISASDLGPSRFALQGINIGRRECLIRPRLNWSLILSRLLSICVPFFH